jgi:hypothetical protein
VPLGLTPTRTQGVALWQRRIFADIWSPERLK